ncbi:Beta-galactosidase [Devosia equisanguinis]|uniref:Beta-galactosidase n=1 Tax=Devosia equisanguinis TaxID=2490941 RepID=A0A447I7T5_9HYPH|nr:sugar-binding domain-containing protein [Devosia equisanguinis]VDS03514.1 Beta-galactosidase [Devosia equisanguinis]
MLTSIPLEGEWAFALDPDNRGEAEQWFQRDLVDTISLPGSVDEAKKTPLSRFRTMAHLSRRHPYIGKAWYARRFDVPEGLEDHFFHIALERPHGEVNIWLDGYKLGRDESLSTAVRMLAGKLSAGSHSLVMMIDNSRFEAVGEAIIRDHALMGDVAHSKTDHTQTNWNGVVGYLRVEAARQQIARVDVDARSHKAKIDIELDVFDADNRWPTWWQGEHDNELVLTFTFAGEDTPLEVRQPIAVDSGFTKLSLEVNLPERARLWDEFDPVVHALRVEWYRDGQLQDRYETAFGIRDFTRDGRHLVLNGRRVFLRGTLDCAIFPLTGYPPTDHAGWEKVFGTARAYGLNHIRYHSWCPPKAAFEVADRMGILLHVETPVWPVLGADPALDRYIHAEAERIVRDYGNHPSFVMLCVGNEVNGSGTHSFLERFIDKWQAQDPRRLYTGGSGWPTVKRADYISKPEPRNQRWGEGLDGRLNARPLETMTDWSEWVDAVPMPLVSHEIGQWCVYPDLEEIAKYTGVLEARNFEMVKADLEAKGLANLAHALMMASGALQSQLYKEEMEAALRTPDMAGVQLLGLQDFPGQGTALVGVVDAFWDEKPYVTPDQFREFCAPIVPLLRAERFVLSEGQCFAAKVQLAQFHAVPLPAGQLRWRLIDADGVAAREGTLAHHGLASGALHDLGTIEIDTAGLHAPARYEVVIDLPGTDYRNRWALWTMPAPGEALPLPIISALDADALARLAAGETLVLTPPPEALKPNAILGHTAAFWNTLWTDGQAPHTLGLLNDTSHPLFRNFPSATHTDWHWFELSFRRRALDIAGTAFRAIVRVVDDWNENRDLLLLGEAQVGRGRLIISAIDLSGALESRPVARAMRTALATYLQYPAAAPQLTPDAVQTWFERITQ